MITILLVLFILTIGLTFANQQETAPPLNQNNDEPKHNSEINNNTQSPLEETPDTPADHITKEFAEAIQSTIQYFSGKKTKIVAIGDSLTQGVGDPTNQGGYVGILDQQLNHDEEIATFENYGKRGNRTSHLLNRLEEPEIRSSLQNADIILITIGANDIMQVVKENFMNITYQIFAEERVHYEERLRQIFSNLKQLNPYASIYLIGFYNPFEQYFEHIEELELIVDDWNNTGLAVAEEFGGTFIPTKDLFISNEVNLFAEDHFHPNELGYQRIAERILNYLVLE